MSTPGTDDEERRLRGLLRAAVPEAPEVAPPTHPRRSRTPYVAALAAAAAVVAVAVVPVLVGGDDGSGPSASLPDAGRAPSRSVDPYRPSCRDPLPPPSRARTTVPDLDQVRSVQLCGDTESLRPFTTGGPGVLGVVAPLDGVVGRQSVADLADELAARPEPDPDRCAAGSSIALRTSLEFERYDGSRVLVTTDTCTDVTVAGRVVSGTDLAAGFLAALDAQRVESRYPPIGRSLPPVDCDSVTTQAPVRPDLRLSGAVTLCPDHNEPDQDPLELTEEQRRALEDALARTPRSVLSDDLGYDDETPYLVFRTALGDVVRLAPVSGGLLLDGWGLNTQQGRTVVPITLDDLTGG